MSRFFLAVALAVFSTALFAKSEMFISADQFGEPQELDSADGRGSVFVTITSATIKDLQDGTSEATIQYDIQNGLKMSTVRWEVEFEIQAENQRELATLVEQGGRLDEESNKSGSLTRRVYTTSAEGDVAGVNIMINDVLFEKVNRHVQF